MMDTYNHRIEFQFNNALKIKALENNLSQFRNQLAASENENIRLRHMLEIVRDNVFCDSNCNCSQTLSDLASHALKRNT
jgi:hypothetical protein